MSIYTNICTILINQIGEAGRLAPEIRGRIVKGDDQRVELALASAERSQRQTQAADFACIDLGILLVKVRFVRASPSASARYGDAIHNHSVRVHDADRRMKQTSHLRPRLP